MWDDDVYVDNTWARVVLGNAATLDACTRLEIQIPIKWSGNSVTIMARTGSAFSQGTTAYLYVVDSNGVANVAGFPLRIGASGTGVPPDANGGGAGGAPSASAGPDAVAAVGAELPLHGSFSGGAAASPSYKWSVASGPGNVTFSNASDPNTTAHFDAPGDYLLQFSVVDASSTITDTVRVSVIPSSARSGIKPKNFFNPSAGETFRILEILDQPGSFSAQIMDRGGHLVRTLDGGDRPAGEQVIEWDGRNDQGSVVASGIYLVLTDAAGRRSSGKVAVIK
jgi:hypothetical protein